MKTKGYASAFDELDELHRAGKIGDARYEMHKQKLLAGARRDNNGLVRFGRTAWTAAAVLALLVVALFLVWLAT